MLAAEFKGEFHFAQQELSFEFSSLGNRRYGSAEAAILGHSAVWVTSTNEAEQRTKLSWRTKDDKPRDLQAVPVTGSQFPGLLKLQLPPDSPQEPSRA